MHDVRLVLIGVAAMILSGCAAPPKTLVTVTDPSVAVADNEAAALVGAGREHLIKGCTAQILKLTDHAIRVKALTCPDSPSMLPLEKWPNGNEGWIAKSATDF